VECVRPEKTAAALKECIDRNYVHVTFKETGTEIGVRLHRPACVIDEAGLQASEGSVQLVGAMTLNYNKVKCVASIDLSTCAGEGFLVPVSDEEYASLMPKEN
jgi:hypothetical protein